MRYAATVKQLIDGRFLARALATDVGVCQATAGSREAALEQLRKEIRYRLEWCPCSGVADDYVELLVSDSAPASASGSSRR